MSNDHQLQRRQAGSETRRYTQAAQNDKQLMTSVTTFVISSQAVHSTLHIEVLGAYTYL
jgi:hypothetical protein